jgi:hypothetical protein
MLKVGSSGRWILQGIGAATLLGLVVRPGLVSSRIDAVLAAAWRTSGDLLVRRDLAALANGIEETRAGLARQRAGRDLLASRLAELEAHRRTIGLRRDRAVERLDRINAILDRLPDGDDRTALGLEGESQRERGQEALLAIVGLDASIRLLIDEMAGADRRIEEIQDRLVLLDGELARLRALDGARRLRRELTEADAIAPGRVDEFLSRPGRPIASLPVQAGFEAR